MTETELEVLLYRGESDMLDYKSAQYKFTNATDAEKVELLKDCLAFANSWRREKGYILIGVTKQTGIPASVVGIPKSEHLDDSRIQQFVNAKTSSPVSFLYEEVDFKGLSVGVIRFDYPQSRPIYLNKDFERLKKDVVYIRRGSSTDECRPAEIAQMGATVTPSKRLAFGIDFVNKFTKKSMGHSMMVNPVLIDRPTWLDTPEPLNLEDLLEMRLLNPLGRRERTKAEKFEAVRDIARFDSFALQLLNDGTGTAQDIEVLIEVAHLRGLEFADIWNAPIRKYNSSMLAVAPTDASVKRTTDGWKLHLHCKSLHAKQIHVFDYLYVSASDEYTIPLQARIYAHDLPDPVLLSMTLHIKPETREYDIALADRFEL